MKRILCIAGGLNAGGAETFLMKVYRELDKTQYQMDFCINTIEECFYEAEVKKLGGKIFRIPAKSSSVRAFKKGLYEIIKNNHYDHVLRITSNAAGFFDLKIAKKAGTAYTIARSSNASDGCGWKKAVVHKIGRFLWMKYVDVKIAPSDLAAKYTFGEKEYASGNVAILNNGLDLNIFRFDKADRKKVRAEFGIGADTNVIGHVGRFMYQKNHRFLIDIFAEIHKRDPGAVLMLVGAGELESAVRDRVKELKIEANVIFTGIRSDIPSLLSAMDVFVFPSLYEGMPNTVIEAQATGLPCVISDTITREANVTGIVKYMSLTDPPSLWAKTAFEQIRSGRADTQDILRENKYDIQSIVKEFTQIVFGKGDA